MTLLASLAVHFGLVAGIVFSYWHGAAAQVTASQPTTEPMVLLLRARETPGPLALATKPVAPSPVAPPTLPTPPAPVAEKPVPVAAQPAAVALEANPNAHIRAIAPDAVLSPTPAPHLNAAAAVVFVLDISGSMYEPFAGATRIAYARENLAARIRALKDGTPFAIALYALRATRSGPLVAASDATREAAVRFVLRDVDCGGGTNLPAGLAAAEELHPGTLVLLTDGDLNMPKYVLATHAHDILGPQDHCPALTIVGIAPRASQKAGQLLADLADLQGGTYAEAPLGASAELVTSAASVIKPAQ